MDPVVHFEMPARDKARMRKFYESSFGWKTKQLGKEMGEYVIAMTSETDKNMMVKKPGTINGGFYQRSDDPLTQAPSFVIQVENLEKSMEKVKAAGGKINREPQDIPGIGMFTSFTDTEGNIVSMMQPRKK